MSNMSTKTLTRADKARLAKAEAKRERRRARNLALRGGISPISIAFSDKMTVAELLPLAKAIDPSVTTKTRKPVLLAILGGAK
jgi:hypothetical protein